MQWQVRLPGPIDRELAELAVPVEERKFVWRPSAEAYRARVETQPREWAPVPWLMRSWRQAAPDPALRVQTRMIDELKTYPGVRQTLSAGTLTRYEKGELVPPLPVVSALERIVGLVPGEISSYLPARKQLQLSRQQQWDLLGRADAAAAIPLSGTDWLDLATLICAGTPQSPERVAFWAHMLVSEMSRSIGAGYRFRIRALKMLAADPVVSGPVEDAIRDHLVACGHTVIGDALAALTEVRHPRGVTLALETYRQLDGSALETAARVLAVDLHAERTRPEHWGALRDSLREDFTSGAIDRRSAATIVASSLRPLQLYELLLPLSQKQGSWVRAGISNSRSRTLPVAEARALRADCADLALDVASGVTSRRSDGFGAWLERLLISGPDPFAAALVIASSPFGYALSHAIEQPVTVASVLRRSARRRREFPFAAVALNSCRRRDPETLVAAYRSGTVSDKRRLLVPLAHHRAFPSDVDLAVAVRETDSASRVIYAAGMSAHPGLAALDPGVVPEALKRAATWWAGGTDARALDC